MVSYFFGVRFTFRTPGGPFPSLSVGKSEVFGRYYLTGSPNCELSVPTSHSTLQRIVPLGFIIFRGRVHVSDPDRPFSSLIVGKSDDFGRYYLTKSPNCEPSVPTSHSTLERAARLNFVLGSGSRFGPLAGRFRA